MNIIGILVALSIFAAVFGAYCATANSASAKELQSWHYNSAAKPHIHFVGREEKVNLSGFEPHHILFSLQSDQTVTGQAELSPQHLGIAIQELERYIAWIPTDCRIFVCCRDGYTPQLLKQLKKLHTARDLYLIEPARYEFHSTGMVVS
jgi:hypothetical protein